MTTPTPPPPGDDGWGRAPEAPSYGQPAPGDAPVPGAAPPPSGQYGQYGQPGGGHYYAVTQPGIIPLRPLSLGELYDGAFKAIRANPPVMFGLAAIVVAVIAVVQSLATWQLQEDLYRIAGTPATSGDLDLIVESLTSTLVPSLIGNALTFVVTTLLNGVLIHSVSQSVIGRTLPLRELWPLVRPQLLRLLGLTLVISLATAVAFGICLLPGALIMVSDLTTGTLLLLLGMLVGLAAMLFVIVVTVLATPVLVLERSGIFGALRRSWSLTMPTFWRVLGIYLLTSVLVAIVAGVIAAPASMVAELVGGSASVLVAQILASTVAAAITTPFMAAVVALLYVDVRIRFEGLDVELAAAAEG